MKFTTTLLLLGALFLGGSTLAQNLVPNPSFENPTNCISGPWVLPGQGTVAEASPWTQATEGSTDHYHPCHTAGIPASNSVPNNFMGSQAAYHGDAYVGIICWDQPGPNYREYIEVQLTSPLAAGTLYEVGFMVSAGDDASKASACLGAHFSNTQIFYPPPYQTTLPQVPQVSFPTVITDKTNWVMETATYAAQGGEQYITIGNFNDDLNTTLVNNGSGFFDRVYYYIDSVWVSAVGPAPVADFTPSSASICPGDCITFTDNSTSPNGPIQSWNWTFQGGTPATAAGQNPGSVCFNTPGSYDVTLTIDDGTAQVSTTQTITVSAPTLTISSPIVICPGATGDLTDPAITAGSSAGTLSYHSSQNDADAGTNAISNPSAAPAGTYYIRLDDGQCHSTGTIDVVEQLPSVDAGPDQSICEGNATIVLAGNPDGAALSWSGGVNNGQAFTPPVGTNTYTVTATLNGCSNTDDIIITVSPVDDASFDFDDFCAGGNNGPSNVATSGGTFAFNPVPGDGATIDASTGEITNGVSGTTYTVEYTTAGACPSSSTQTVTVISFSLTATVTDDDCSQGLGAVDLSVSGGSGTYTYAWQPGGQTTQDLNGLTMGNYTVTVTDANNTACNSTDTYTVNDIGAPPAPTVTYAQETCTGDCNATITVTLAQPDSVVFSINNGGQVWNNYTGVFTDLCPGDYLVEVIPAMGCNYPTNQVLLVRAPAINWNTSQTYNVDSDCQVVGGSGSVSAAADGGWVDQYTYEWYELPNDTTLLSNSSTVGNLMAGDYMVTATEDSTGCSIDTVLSVGQIDPVADFTVDTTWTFAPHTILLENTSQNSTSWTWEIISGNSGDTVSYSTSSYLFSPDTTVSTPDTVTICLHAFRLGCEDIYCQTVVLAPVSTLRAPNVFTPNKDNVNDLFYLPVEGMLEYEVKILDRWGRHVIDLTRENPSWDGNSKSGKEMAEGVYFYHYRLEGYDGTEYVGQGAVTLIRK